MFASPIQLYGPTTVPKPTLAPLQINQHPLAPVQTLLPSPPTTPQPKTELTTSAKHLMHHALHPDFVAKYSLGEELGSGGFGFVLSARDRQTGREVAVKFIFREKVPYHAWVRTEQGVLPMEIYVLKHVNHPSIIGFLDNYEDDRFCYLVMELHGTQWGPTNGLRSPALSQTLSEDSWTTTDDDYTPPPPPPSFARRRTSCDLFECIERHHNFDEPLARQIFKQIVECVAHLDTLGICHRDIKDENIVIDDQYRVSEVAAIEKKVGLKFMRGRFFLWG